MSEEWGALSGDVLITRWIHRRMVTAMTKEVDSSVPGRSPGRRPIRGGVMKRHWHIYYRTTTMADNGENGWKKAVVQVEGDEHAALQQFVEKTRNLLYVRIYEGNTCLAARVDHDPRIEITHDPHARYEEE